MVYQVNPAIANLQNFCRDTFKTFATKFLDGLRMENQADDVIHLAGSYGRAIGEDLAYIIKRNPELQTSIIKKHNLDGELPQPGSELHTKAFTSAADFLRSRYTEFQNAKDITRDTEIKPYFGDGSRLFSDLDPDIHQDAPNSDLDQLTTVGKLTDYLLARGALGSSSWALSL